jgi:hypothetical protein
MLIRIQDPESGIFLTLDPGSGWKNSDPGSASLVVSILIPSYCQSSSHSWPQSLSSSKIAKSSSNLSLFR